MTLEEAVAIVKPLNDKIAKRATTPATWRIDGRTFSEHGMFHISNGDYIVAHALGQTATSETEAKANARLIAAAPDMLAALIAADAALDKATHGDEYGEFDAQFKQIKAAIAKATSA